MRAAGPRAAAGFTLVELMVVGVIIVLIGGIAYSSWIAILPNQRFNSAIRNLSEVLFETRSDAIARNRRFEIHYDLEADRYWVRTPFRPGGGFATTDDEEHLLVKETDLSRMGIDLMEVTIGDTTYSNKDTDVWVVFSPLGSSAYHTIQLRQTQFERDFTLELLPLTGEIRMHDGLFEREPAEESDFK